VLRPVPGFTLRDFPLIAKSVLQEKPSPCLTLALLLANNLLQTSSVSTSHLESQLDLPLSQPKAHPLDQDDYPWLNSPKSTNSGLTHQRISLLPQKTFPLTNQRLVYSRTPSRFPCSLKARLLAPKRGRLPFKMKVVVGKR
jgi:hypothetical protein